MFVLNCLLQIEQVNSKNDDSDDDPLALALHSLHIYLDPDQTAPLGSTLYAQICLSENLKSLR